MGYMKLIVMAAFVVTACTDATTDRSKMTAEGANQSGSAERADVGVGSATHKAQPRERGDGLGFPPPTPSNAEATKESPPLSLSMPERIRGKWRRSTEAKVTAAECVDSASANMGLILTIRPDGFSRFEDGGRLIRVQERDSSRIRAIFDTTYADTPTQGEFMFDAQDSGQTLIERQYGDGAQPGVLRYRRCPSS